MIDHEANKELLALAVKERGAMITGKKHELFHTDYSVHTFLYLLYFLVSFFAIKDYSLRSAISIARIHESNYNRSFSNMKKLKCNGLKS
jgi:hypothetical protein